MSVVVSVVRRRARLRQNLPLEWAEAEEGGSSKGSASSAPASDENERGGQAVELTYEVRRSSSERRERSSEYPSRRGARQSPKMGLAGLGLRASPVEERRAVDLTRCRDGSWSAVWARSRSLDSNRWSAWCWPCASRQIDAGPGSRHWVAARRGRWYEGRGGCARGWSRLSLVEIRTTGFDRRLSSNLDGVGNGNSVGGGASRRWGRKGGRRGEDFGRRTVATIW